MFLHRHLIGAVAVVVDCNSYYYLLTLMSNLSDWNSDVNDWDKVMMSIVVVVVVAVAADHQIDSK